LNNLKENAVKIARLIAVLCFCVLGGCSYVKPGASDLLPPYESADTYNQIKLKESTSADVLTAITKPKDELLSQSKSVVASQGIKKKGHKLWLTMIAFDENEPTARRKYFFVVDEKAEILLLPRRHLSFDSEIVLEPKVLEEPYANENARRIAILKQVLENSRRDTAEVAPDNKMIGICGGLINQTLTTVLQRLEESPVLASKLSTGGGFGFDHITIGKGTITMNVEEDIVKVKVRVGSFVWEFTEDPFSLEQ
jgi:hypothetical protein